MVWSGLHFSTARRRSAPERGINPCGSDLSDLARGRWDATESAEVGRRSCNADLTAELNGVGRIATADALVASIPALMFNSKELSPSAVKSD